MFTTSPNRPYRMNYVFCWQIEPRGKHSLTGFTATKLTAELKQIWPRSAMYGVVYASSAQQSRTCCIDNGINIKRCDVCFNQANTDHASFVKYVANCRQLSRGAKPPWILALQALTQETKGVWPNQGDFASCVSNGAVRSSGNIGSV